MILGGSQYKNNYSGSQPCKTLASELEYHVEFQRHMCPLPFAHLPSGICSHGAECRLSKCKRGDGEQEDPRTPAAPPLPSLTSSASSSSWGAAIGRGSQPSVGPSWILALFFLTFSSLTQLS